MEIYRALKSLGAEWNINPKPTSSMMSDEKSSAESEEDSDQPDPFVIKCRWRVKDGINIPDNETIYVHMEVQLYQLEPGNHLVDFKCDGYEIEVSSIPESSSSIPGGSGDSDMPPQGIKRDDSRSKYASNSHRTLAKDVSSAFPFLDVATRLITELAVVK